MRRVYSGSTIVAAALMLLSVDCASADLIIHSTSRSVGAGYSFVPDTTPGSGTSDFFNGLGAWKSTVATDPFKASDGMTFDSSAWQSSSISTSHVSLSSVVHASASPAADESGPFDLIHSIGQSDLTMTFSVAAPTPIELFADYSLSGSGFWSAPASSFILIESADEEFAFKVLTGEGESNHELLLQPGEYTLSVAHFVSAGSGTLNEMAISEFSSSLNFEMIVIPAPGAVLLFSFAALAARRRRTH